jgi:hypothetical protein
LKNTTICFLMLMALLLAAGACRRGRAAGGPASTETIAPSAPQPAPTGTDAMTQTVDIEDSRSEEDGGMLTARQSVKPSTAASKTTRKKTKK